MTTPLDLAHRAMAAAPQDEAARRAFYDRLTASELFVLLDAEAEGDRIRPRLFPLESGPVALIFDTEARLAEFAGDIAPYASLSGRALARMLAGEAIGLGLNLGVAASEFLMGPDAVTWLAEIAAGPAPEEITARAERLAPPGALPEALLPALDARLASAVGLARAAYLARAHYAGGAQGHLIGFLDTTQGAEPALAAAVAEALRFSGVDAASLDVGFFAVGSAMAESLDRVGLRIDLPQAPAAAPKRAGTAPGLDPDRPPKLR